MYCRCHTYWESDYKNAYTEDICYHGLQWKSSRVCYITAQKNSCHRLVGFMFIPGFISISWKSGSGSWYPFWKKWIRILVIPVLLDLLAFLAKEEISNFRLFFAYFSSKTRWIIQRQIKSLFFLSHGSESVDPQSAYLPRSPSGWENQLW